MKRAIVVKYECKKPMRKGGIVEKSSTRVQPEATANTKHLFFLDVGRMPVALAFSSTWQAILAQ